MSDATFTHDVFVSHSLRDNRDAGRSEGAEAVRLLSEAVTAYREALKVYPKEHLRYYHGVVSRNLQ